jgi:hypothetical protein
MRLDTVSVARLARVPLPAGATGGERNALQLVLTETTSAEASG